VDIWQSNKQRPSIPAEIEEIKKSTPPRFLVDLCAATL
jgi:hypothetical protein